MLVTFQVPSGSGDVADLAVHEGGNGGCVSVLERVGRGRRVGDGHFLGGYNGGPERDGQVCVADRDWAG